MKSTARGFLEHWAWVADKGLMNKHTADGLRAACAKVLAAFDDLDEVEMTSLDVEETLVRFQNLAGRELKPKTLEEYKRRFRMAVDSYLSYVADPGGWEAPVRQRKKKQRKGTEADLPEQSTGALKASHLISTSQPIVDYPFPLRDKLIARLILPRDLRAREVKRLTAFMMTLAVDEVGEHEDE
jgi:hypothetical protein